MKMEAWARLFGSYLRNGVYPAGIVRSNSVIIKAALARGLKVSRIDVKDVKSKAGFLAKVADGLEFPDYFGMNWDALADCLGQTCAKTAGGRVIIFTGFGRFAARCAAESRVAEKIFARAAGSWKEENSRFYIILGA